MSWMVLHCLHLYIQFCTTWRTWHDQLDEGYHLCLQRSSMYKEMPSSPSIQQHSCTSIHPSFSHKKNPQGFSTMSLVQFPMAFTRFSPPPLTKKPTYGADAWVSDTWRYLLLVNADDPTRWMQFWTPTRHTRMHAGTLKTKKVNIPSRQLKLKLHDGWPIEPIQQILWSNDPQRSNIHAKSLCLT